MSEIAWPVPLFKAAPGGKVIVVYAHNQKELSRKTLPENVGGADCGFTTSQIRSEWPKLRYHATLANEKSQSPEHDAQLKARGYQDDPIVGIHCNIDPNAKPVEVSSFNPAADAKTALLQSQVESLTAMVEKLAGKAEPRKRGRKAAPKHETEAVA